MSLPAINQSNALKWFHRACVFSLVGTFGYFYSSALYIKATSIAAILIGIYALLQSFLLHRPYRKGRFLLVTGVGIIVATIAGFGIPVRLVDLIIIIFEAVRAPTDQSVLSEITKLLKREKSPWESAASIAIGFLIIVCGMYQGREYKGELTISETRNVQEKEPVKFNLDSEKPEKERPK